MMFPVAQMSQSWGTKVLKPSLSIIELEQDEKLPQKRQGVLL